MFARISLKPPYTYSTCAVKLRSHRKSCFTSFVLSVLVHYSLLFKLGTIFLQNLEQGEPKKW